ncbi:MAG: PH domain-containing protein [Pyrinomonadaceae bacterium]|nr:PH domain-containing protein [Chloracidobacterium sp.]MBP7415681.1 PH domain-containing protein [Pyrinomonadaceae bacterium]
MYCEKCGADNSETAKFCRKCGADTDVEMETRVAVRENAGDGETEIFSISPTLMFVKAGYVLAAIGALFFVALLSIFLSAFVSVWLAIILSFTLFLIPAFYHFKQKLVRYRLTDSTLEIDSGFISRTTQNVPIRRIQDVTVTTSVMQRLLGFGDLVVDNASEEGGKIVLKNINTPKEYADKLLAQMRENER